jgi:hypothetical protein
MRSRRLGDKPTCCIRRECRVLIGIPARAAISWTRLHRPWERGKERQCARPQTSAACEDPIGHCHVGKAGARADQAAPCPDTSGIGTRNYKNQIRICLRNNAPGGSDWSRKSLVDPEVLNERRQTARRREKLGLLRCGARLVEKNHKWGEFNSLADLDSPSRHSTETGYRFNDRSFNFPPQERIRIEGEGIKPDAYHHYEETGQYCLWRVHAGLGQTLEVIFPD